MKWRPPWWVHCPVTVDSNALVADWLVRDLQVVVLGFLHLGAHAAAIAALPEITPEVLSRSGMLRKYVIACKRAEPAVLGRCRQLYRLGPRDRVGGQRFGERCVVTTMAWRASDVFVGSGAGWRAFRLVRECQLAVEFGATTGQLDWLVALQWASFARLMSGMSVLPRARVVIAAPSW